MAFNRNRGNPRSQGNRPASSHGHRGGPRTQGNRKNSDDTGRHHRRDRNRSAPHPHKNKRIAKKDKEPKKDEATLKEELDRQIREYWIKTGAKKGKEQSKEEQDLATKKLNEEMDQYWKKAA